MKRNLDREKEVNDSQFITKIPYLFSTDCRNSLKSLKAVPGPHRPSLFMYAIFFGSDAPKKIKLFD